jgi:hypothetical protein
MRKTEKKNHPVGTESVACFPVGTETIASYPSFPAKPKKMPEGLRRFFLKEKNGKTNFQS